MDASMGEQWVQQLCRATNAHDLEALVDCFAEDYVNEAPAHPARGFRGRNQVRTNWTQIFGAFPDFACTVRSVAAGDTVWSEWDMRGTRRDGVPHVTRGVVIFVLADGRATSARFYLEPVDESPAGVDAAIRELAEPRGSAPAAQRADSR
jgi:ketosteroid isomerase-like protein